MITFNTSLRLRVIGLILSLFLVISTFSSCKGDQGNQQPEGSEKTASATNITTDAINTTDVTDTTAADHSASKEENPVLQLTDHLAKLTEGLRKKSPAEKIMQAGGVSVSTKNKAWEPLVKWYCENMLSEYGTSYKWTYMTDKEYSYIGGIRLYHALYRVSFRNQGEEAEKDILILFGSLLGEENRYYLIDGCVTLTDYYPLRANWRKIKKHALLGMYAGVYPQPDYPREMIAIDYDTLLGGGGQEVLSQFYLAKNMVGVFSAEKGYRFENNTFQTYEHHYKIDFVNLTNGTLRAKSFDLPELDFDGKRRFLKREDSSYGFRFYFYLDIPGRSQFYETYTFNAGTYEAKREIYTQNSEHLDIISDSYRYVTILEGDVLYLWDKKDPRDEKALIYDGSSDTGGGKSPLGKLFANDVLYYTVTENGRTDGFGFYNPVTKQKGYYQNGLNPIFYTEGYVYCLTDRYGGDYYFARFGTDTPGKTERLLENDAELSSSQIILLPDQKHILKVTGLYENNKKQSTVTVYDAATFQVQKTFPVASPANYFGNAIVIDEYLYISSDSRDIQVAFTIKMADLY